MFRSTALAVIGIVMLWCGAAVAEASHPAYLATVFSVEDKPTNTTACMEVAERTYSRAKWWEDAAASDDPAERAFKAMLAAMKRQDRDGLLQLSHPTLGRDPKRFEEQASAFFQQFQIVVVTSVPKAYELDGLAIFYAKLQIHENSVFVPFLFAREDSGAYGFLPYRTDLLTYQLLDAWFRADRGPAKTEHPAYCTEDEVKHTTHRIALVSPLGSGGNLHPSVLFLRGGSLETTGSLSGTAQQVKTTFEQMAAALKAGNRDEFVKHLTPEGGRRLKEWFASASEADFNVYKDAILKQKPYFFFDVSPLVVVYTKSAKDEVQVMYFTPGPMSKLLWTNSAFLSISDSVYKTGPMLKAAMLEKPFSNIEIK